MFFNPKTRGKEIKINRGSIGLYVLRSRQAWYPFNFSISDLVYRTIRNGTASAPLDVYVPVHAPSHLVCLCSC
jgi:hypothetical protein